MNSKRIIFFFILLISVNFIIAQQTNTAYGFNSLSLPGFNNGTAFVNASQFWNTLSLGPLDDANSTQFFSNGGELNILESYLESFGDGEWLELSGGNANQNINIGAFDFNATNLLSRGLYINTAVDTDFAIKSIAPTAQTDVGVGHSMVSSAGLEFTGGATESGYIGGELTFISGDGGNISGQSVQGTAGAGGTLTFTSGTGGIATNSGANNGGGTGGLFSMTSGDGADALTTTTGANFGATGGQFELTSGDGGDGFNATAFNLGGQGGAFFLKSGDGGDTSGFAQQGGVFSLVSGDGGGGGGSASSGGTFFLDTGVGGNGGSSGVMQFKIGGSLEMVLLGDGTGLSMFADSNSIFFGSAKDSSIRYDGTNMILDPDLVGSGIVLIGATGDDDLVAGDSTFENTNINDSLTVNGTSHLTGGIDISPSGDTTITPINVNLDKFDGNLPVNIMNFRLDVSDFLSTARMMGNSLIDSVPSDDASRIYTGFKLDISPQLFVSGTPADTRNYTGGDWTFGSEGTLVGSPNFNTIGLRMIKLVSVNLGSGTVNNRGIDLAGWGGGTGVTEKIAIISNGGDWIMDHDDSLGSLFFGASQDASIGYDGSDFIINPKEVGSGSVIIEGNLNITNNTITDIFCLNFSNGDTICGSSSIDLTINDTFLVRFAINNTQFVGDVENLHNINNFSRFFEHNINDGPFATAVFTAQNDIDLNVHFGITSSGFNNGNANIGPNQGFLFFQTLNTTLFANGGDTGFKWLNDLVGAQTFIDTDNTLMTLSKEGELTVSTNITAINITASNTVFAGDVNSQGLFDRIDNVTEIDSDVIFNQTLPVLYAADTTNNEITINITFGTNASFQVWDAKRKFNVNSVFINVLNSDGVTIDHSAELDTRNKAFQFYFNGTVWNYGEIGRGQFVPISSAHDSIADFGNLIQESDNHTDITVIGSMEFTGIGIGSQKVISLLPASMLESNANWKGFFINGSLLDPTGEGADIVGLEIDFSDLNITNNPVVHGIKISVPSRLDAIHIYEGQLVIDNQPTGGITTEFSALDIRVDTINLHSSSVWSALGVTAVGGSAGTIAAVLARNNVEPIRQEIGTFTTPSQTEFAGRKTSNGTVWADGVDGIEIFVGISDEVYLGSVNQFSQIEIIMGTIADKDVQPTFWYNTAADTWVEFFPVDETSGFQSSSLVSWEPDSISGSWTNDGDPAGGDTSTGYWIKIIRVRVEDEGTPTPTTMKTGTVEAFGWDEQGVISVKNVTTTDRFVLGNGASIGYNATCQMIFYNSTGSVMSTMGCN